jgi:hypothetical protein
MDLIRELLLAIENGKQEFTQADRLENNEAEPAAIFYHLRLLNQAGYLAYPWEDVGGTSYGVQGLTWEGHEFIDTIRDPEVWKRTKGAATKAGGWTVGLIKDLGTAYLKHVIKERAGIDLG